MAFEWQNQDAAAETLGVDVATLQGWIDEGRAPTRTVAGQVQVLIEFPEDEQDAAAGAGDGGAAGSASGTEGLDGGEGDRGASDGRGVAIDISLEADGAERGGDDRQAISQVAHQTLGEDAFEHANQETGVRLVTQREMQIAAGMVAAWQQVAERSDAELARARRINLAAWTTAAVLAVAAIGGMTWAVYAMTDLEGDLAAAQVEVRRVNELKQELDETTDKLDAARTALSEAQVQVASLSEQQKAAKEMAATHQEAGRTVAQAMRITVQQQNDRVQELQAQLAAARGSLDDVVAKMEEAESAQVAGDGPSADALAANPSALRQELNRAIQRHISAAAELGRLNDQISNMKTALDQAGRR